MDGSKEIEIIHGLFLVIAMYWSSPSVSTNFPISEFSYFVIRFLNHIFFVINFSYFVIRFLLNSSIVKFDNEIGFLFY